MPDPEHAQRSYAFPTMDALASYLDALATATRTQAMISRGGDKALWGQAYAWQEAARIVRNSRVEGV